MVHRCHMVHIRPPCVHHWHLSTYPNVAPRIVSWRRRNLCQVSVTGRWRIASRQLVMQVSCKHATFSKVWRVWNHSPPTANWTFDWLQHYVKLWSTFSSVPVSCLSDFHRFGPLKKRVAGEHFMRYQHEASSHLLTTDTSHWLYTFMLPCIVIDFLLNNLPDALIIQIYSVIKLYMFRASSLPIVRSFLLYIRHW